MFEVALDRGRAQQLVDALGLLEALVDPEADIGREFQIDAVGDFAAQEFLVALKGGEHLIGVAAGERHDVDGRQPQVGGHAHLRHGNEMALDHRVMHVAAGEHLGHGVTHQLADAQLALRAPRRAAVAVTFFARHCNPMAFVVPGLVLGIHVMTGKRWNYTSRETVRFGLTGCV